MKLLWLAPNLNHYKARFLNELQKSGKISLFLLGGTPAKKDGYASFADSFAFQFREVAVPKAKWGHSLPLLRCILNWHKEARFDWIMAPAEGKFLFLVIGLSIFRKISGFKLFSYNHAFAGKSRRAEFMTRFLYRFFDRVVFYTEHERELALAAKLLPESKAFFANNTLDHKTVDPYYRFEIKDRENPALLFIGRLIPNKRVDALLDHYGRLKDRIPGLKLLIIGDGPQAALVRKAAAEDENIEWFGALSDEAKIAPVMKRADVVCNLGASGLSVMHSFIYGKPYIAMTRADNGPECWYLRDGQNGLMLSEENTSGNLDRIVSLFADRDQYEKMCRAARATAEKYSVESWIEEIECALLK